MLVVALVIGNSALKSLEDRLAIIKKKILGLQFLNISSLDFILNKLEERLAFIKTKMTFINTKIAFIETKIIKVNRIAALSAKLG